MNIQKKEKNEHFDKKYDKGPFAWRGSYSSAGQVQLNSKSYLMMFKGKVRKLNHDWVGTKYRNRQREYLQVPQRTWSSFWRSERLYPPVMGRSFDSEGAWHFFEIHILTLKMLKIYNLSSSGKKINKIT